MAAGEGGPRFFDGVAPVKIAHALADVPVSMRIWTELIGLSGLFIKKDYDLEEGYEEGEGGIGGQSEVDIIFQNASYTHRKFSKSIFKGLACTLRSAVTTSSTA